ncbi:spermatogenesis- and oogenesis-specific basic helix-loop-helix-containing protein 2 [Choloepus didactylus]|uniref:spermatogenesis- and oogenesis-specific basic helix-loop-helix-containing protein 2 n=1 Tax=Choloepus didactylus TaxID=27675 RepID=UPI00189D8A8E|nr:spermatogenesis- and oogenesis-specific basic helix-loop-helix-containing protein 2 [Choloepus didactylus]
MGLDSDGVVRGGEEICKKPKGKEKPGVGEGKNIPEDKRKGSSLALSCDSNPSGVSAGSPELSQATEHGASRSRAPRGAAHRPPPGVEDEERALDSRFRWDQGSKPVQGEDFIRSHQAPTSPPQPRCHGGEKPKRPPVPNLQTRAPSRQRPRAREGRFKGARGGRAGGTWGAAMAASSACGEPGPSGAQAKIDLLLVGDVIVGNLADNVQKLFSNTAKVRVTMSDVKQAAAFLAECMFNLVFLKKASLPNAEELEAVKLIRFGKKKNTHLLFVLIIPENFEDCISGHGADIILTEPLTMEKISFVVHYWKTYFSNTVKKENALRPEEPSLPLQTPCSEHLGGFSTDLITRSESLGGGLGLELKVSLSDFKKSKISLLHSSKEKLRRERIKESCEQLRALLPPRRGRKNDAASVLEAAAEHLRQLRERLPPAALRQITEVLQSNRRFCKKQPMLDQLSLPGPVVAQRENCALTNTHSPVGEIRFLADKCLSMCSVPAAGDPLHGALKGPSSSASGNAVGELYRSLGPGAALSLSSSHAALPVRVCPRGASLDTAAGTSPSLATRFPLAVPGAARAPQHCLSSPGQARMARAACLQQVWAYE